LHPEGDLSARLVVFRSGAAAAHDVTLTARNGDGENAQDSPLVHQPGACVNDQVGGERQCDLLVGRIEIVTVADLYDDDDPALELAVDIAKWLHGRIPLEARLTVAPRFGHPTSAKPEAHSCTLTDEGTCIRGGEFCRDRDEGTYGYDTDGVRYYCTDGHWEVP
jgi:hypothetical protein